jgi:hypothetical protein
MANVGLVDALRNAKALLDCLGEPSGRIGRQEYQDICDTLAACEIKPGDDVVWIGEAPAAVWRDVYLLNHNQRTDNCFPVRAIFPELARDKPPEPQFAGLNVKIDTTLKPDKWLIEHSGKRYRLSEVTGE